MSNSDARTIARLVITFADDRQTTIEVHDTAGWHDFYHYYAGAGDEKKHVGVESPLKDPITHRWACGPGRSNVMTFDDLVESYRRAYASARAQYPARRFPRLEVVDVAVEILDQELLDRFMAGSPADLPGWKPQPPANRFPTFSELRGLRVQLPSGYTSLERRRQLMTKDGRK